TLHFSSKNHFSGGPNKSGNTSKPGAAVRLGDLLHRIKQLGDLRLIARSFATVARGIDAGSAVQGLNFQTGVISDRREARKLMIMSSLEQRIFFECGSCLDFVRRGCFIKPNDLYCLMLEY